MAAKKTRKTTKKSRKTPTKRAATTRRPRSTTRARKGEATKVRRKSTTATSRRGKATKVKSAPKRRTLKRPKKRAAIKGAAVKRAAGKKAAVRKAVVRKAAVKKSAAKKAAIKKAAVKKAAVKKAAVKKAAIKKAAVKRAAKKAAVKKAAKKALVKKALVKKATTGARRKAARVTKRAARPKKSRRVAKVVERKVVKKKKKKAAKVARAEQVKVGRQDRSERKAVGGEVVKVKLKRPKAEPAEVTELPPLKLGKKKKKKKRREEEVAQPERPIEQVKLKKKGLLKKDSGKSLATKAVVETEPQVSAKGGLKVRLKTKVRPGERERPLRKGERGGVAGGPGERRASKDASAREGRSVIREPAPRVPSLPLPVLPPIRKATIEERSAMIDQRLAGQSEDFKKRYLDSFDMSWIYHDSALEGVVYTFEELRAALSGPQFPFGDSSLQPTYEDIRRHKEAIEYVRDFGARKKGHPITVDSIKKLYLILHPEEGDIKTVKYRKDIPQHRLYFHEYAPPDKIAYKVRQIVDWLNDPETRKTRNGIRIAARAHFDLLRVYPFPNDSGKVARLFMNMILLRSGLPPSIIHSTERQRYYEALKSSAVIVLQMVQESVENALASVEKLLDEHETRKRSFVS